MGKRLRRIILSKNTLMLVAVFLLSGIHIYGDILPFGMSALASFGANSLSILAYTLGIVTSRAGNFSFLRHSFSPFIYILTKKLFKDKVPPAVLSGFSVLLGGTFALLMIRENYFLYFGFVLAEAVFSFIFTLVFKEAGKALFIKIKGGKVDETGFAFGIISLMTLCLSFSEIEFSNFSLASSLMLVIGMASSYKHKAPVSVVVNLAAGFFSFVFTPKNPGAVAYLALSGFSASLLKKYGKFLIPFTYIFFLPFFLNVNILKETFSLYDIAVSSLIFLFMPGRVLDFIDIIPNSQKEEAACLHLSERVNSVADTFQSIADIFAKADFKEEEVVLSKNSRTIQLENLWQNHIKEETLALACQMGSISKMLKSISRKEDLKLLRDDIKEKEIRESLKKRGIGVRKISAGINKKGVFEVILKLIPCKGGCICDNLIPSVIKEVTGKEVLRFGVKNCSDCRICYTESPGYSLDVSVSEIPKEETSGDALAFAYVDEEHFAVALSDGMGTGIRAREKSEIAVKLALRLLSLGMDLPSTVNMVNALLLRQGGDGFATLDIALLNLETGKVKFTKNAAAAGYVLTCGGKVKKLCLNGTPLGIVGITKTEEGSFTLKDGDFLIMVSDGVTDSFGPGKENELFNIIQEFTGGDSEDLAEYIMLKAGTLSKNKIKDDMTAITVGCIKKQKSGNNKEKRRLEICEATGR